MSEANRTEEFWDKDKDEIFARCKDVRSGEFGELFDQTLPKLALHFDGKALDGLKQANPWLAVFEPSSTAGWKQAQGAFLDNGPVCLDVLASFTDLTRSENQIGIMLSRDITLFTRLLLAIRDEIERHGEKDPQTVDEHAAQQMSKLTNEILDAAEAENVTRSRIEMLLRNRVKAQEGKESSTNKAGSFIG
jgi:hypothetical protein